MSNVTRRNFIKAGSLLTAATVLGAGYSHPAWAKKRPKYRLKYANNLPISHPMNIRAKEMVEAIAVESDGEIDIRIYPSSQLGNDTDTLAQIRSGAVDFFMLSPIILGSLITNTQISGVGFAFQNYDQVWGAMDGDLGAAVRQTIEDNSSLMAFEKIWDNGFRIITTSNKAIYTPEDLVGLKLRVPPSPLWTSMFRGFDAAPTTINFAETYSALQTKIADGQENPITLVESAKLYEVQKYLSVTNHMWDGFWFLANKNKFKQLPDDVQVLIQKHANQAAMNERADLVQLSLNIKSTLEGQGMVFNDVDSGPFRDKLRQAGFYEEWHKTFGNELWSTLESAVGSLS